MMTVVCRSATTADDALIQQFRDENADSLRSERGGEAFVDYELALARATPEQTTLIGELDGITVGVVTWIMTDSTTARLIEFFVINEARAVGVGDELMVAAKANLVASGVTSLDSWALPGMRASKNFFEAAGFTARLIVMRTQLGTN